MSLPRKYMVEKRVCGTCVHYRQHYVRTEQGNYYPLWYGHCIHPWRRHPECLSYRIRRGKSKRTDRSQNRMGKNISATHRRPMAGRTFETLNKLEK